MTGSIHMNHCSGSALIDLLGNKPSHPPGTYLYILAQPFERGRLAACPVHRKFFPPQVLHHNALFQRGAPVKGRSCQIRLFGQGYRACPSWALWVALEPEQMPGLLLLS